MGRRWEARGWEKVVRTFRDGHREEWWTLEVEAGPYGVARAKRALVVTTDPATLPDLATWYLTTTLPAPGSERAHESGLAPASVAEVVRLYGLRMWGSRATSRSSTCLVDGALTRSEAK
jgi:hypothetical protein